MWAEEFGAGESDGSVGSVADVVGSVEVLGEAGEGGYGSDDESIGEVHVPGDGCEDCVGFEVEIADAEHGVILAVILYRPAGPPLRLVFPLFYLRR